MENKFDQECSRINIQVKEGHEVLKKFIIKFILYFKILHCLTWAFEKVSTSGS